MNTFCVLLMKDSGAAKVGAGGNCFRNSQDKSFMLELSQQSYNLNKNLVQQSSKIWI